MLNLGGFVCHILTPKAGLHTMAPRILLDRRFFHPDEWLDWVEPQSALGGEVSVRIKQLTFETLTGPDKYQIFDETLRDVTCVWVNYFPVKPQKRFQQKHTFLILTDIVT